MDIIGKQVRARGKGCECQGAVETEIQGTVMKLIDASNGQWLMLDTPNGTKTVKLESVFEVI